MKSLERVRAGAWLILCLASAVSAIAAPPHHSIWKKGSDINGICRATVGGKLLMNGSCAGLGHGDSIFVTAARDGCSIELTRARAGVSGKIFAYKNSCGDLDDDVQLGSFKQVGNCWTSASAKVCLKIARRSNR